MVLIAACVMGTHSLMHFTFGIFLRPLTIQFGWERGALSAAWSKTWVIGGLLGIVAGKLTDKYAQEIGYKSLDALAEAIYKLEVEYNKLMNIKPVFRLHPPKKGFKGKVKRSYTSRGVTGYRGEAINDILKRMT